MRWATTKLAHFDRIASAWLILRFIDSDAAFVFLSPGEKVPEDATGFGMHGAKFSAHDGSSSTFAKLAETFVPQNKALGKMAQIIDRAVAMVMNGHDETNECSLPLVATVLGLTEGIMLTSPTDLACVLSSLPLYDSLYARLEMQELIEAEIP